MIHRHREIIALATMKFIFLVALTTCSSCWVLGNRLRIINNSGNDNRDNDVKNGNDEVSGNLVNGNENGNNTGSGNVGLLRPLIINNSGNNNSKNHVSNENDQVSGNLVNGNGNGDNTQSGNIQNFIINNSGNGNSNNSVGNGNDNVDGNLVNGNSNGGNSNSGNVGKPSTATESSDQDSRELLQRINALLNLIKGQLKVINKIPNDVTSNGGLLSALAEVRGILQNLLRSLNNTPEVFIDSVVTSRISNLISDVNYIISMVLSKLPNPLAGIIPSLGAILNHNNGLDVDRIPALLQRVIGQLQSLL